MRTRSLACITLTLFLFSCAGGPGIRDEAPEWAAMPPQGSESEYAFRGSGEGETSTLARSAAQDDLADAVLAAMGLGSPDTWADEGSAAVDRFIQDLGQAVRNPENSQIDGLIVARRDSWYNQSGRVTYTVDILWDKESFTAASLALAELVGVASVEYQAFGERARDAEIAGNAYEAALLWAAAAGVAEDENNQSAFRLALRGIDKVMRGLSYRVVSVPGTAYVGLRPAEPVVFEVSSTNKVTSNAEFVITYPRAGRDGSLQSGTARVNTDRDGLLRFRPPEVAFAGTQEITIAPSARPFLEYLDNPDDIDAAAFVAGLESPTLSAEYQALTRLRTVPMGVVILETDLAGNPLNSDAAARGLIDDLLSDGFNVEIMDLDPREMIPAAIGRCSGISRPMIVSPTGSTGCFMPECRLKVSSRMEIPSPSG